MATVTSSKRQLTHTSNTYESNGDVTIGGNLNINGTTTTIDTANLLVEDKNIIIGDVSSPSDSTADGGGITLKGASDKTINWVNSTDSWTSNQRFSAPNLTLTGLSAQNSEATALVVNGSNVVGTRELGSNAFNSTSFLTSYTETDTLATVAGRGATTSTALQLGPSATNGGRIFSQAYSGSNRLGVMSSYYGSGALVLGYGAEGKSGSAGFVSTYSNFSGGHSALSIANQTITWSVDGSNSQTAIGSDLTLNEEFKVDRSGVLTMGDGFTSTKGNTAYTDRNKWDGGSSGLTAATGRTSLGLGTAATSASSAFATSAQGTKADNALPKAGGTMSGNIVMGDNDVTGIDQLTFSSGTFLTDVSSNYVKLRYASSSAGGIIVYDGDNALQGYLYADGASTPNFGLLDSTGTWAVKCRSNEYVQLLYDNAAKLQTASGGVTVTGVISATGGNSTNWNTAYTDRNKWDGGSTGLNASTGRTSLGLGSAATQNTSAFAAASHSHAASDITSGTLADARIPSLAASKITSGTFADARIPSLAASKITSGTIAAARLSTASTQPPNDNSTKIATTAYVQTELTDLIGAAPAALDTLSELADAINDDASFSSTVTTALGNRLRVDTASQGLNSTQKSNARTNLGLGTAATSASTAFAAASHTHTFASLTSKPEFVENGQLQYRTTTTPDTAGDAAGVTFNYMSSTATNRPAGTDHSLLTMGYANNWQTQIAQDWREGGRIYIRGQENGTWSSWSRVHSTDDFSTTDVANGVTAHGWGNHASAGYNTIIGTDSDINTSGSTIIDNIFVTDGVITSMGTRTLTLANLGYTGATNANNYSLPEATATARGGIELFSNTDQSVAANSVSSTASRTYGIQLNSAGQAVVNVPWVDTNTNTTYSAGTGITLSGTTFSLTDTASKLSLSGGTMTGTLNSRDIQFANGYHLTRSNHSSGHLEGSYNNVGANASKSNPIYTIGSSYNPTDTALSNMYGIGYNHTDASFISFTGASGWGQYVAADGDARIFLCGSNGVISSTGEHYVGSSKVFHDTYHPNADTLTTARTIALSGDVTGSVSFNGSSNVSMSTLTNKLRATDDRDVKPSTTGIGASGVAAIKAFFTTFNGMTGSSGGAYQDMIALDTYSDSSGGGPSAMTFSKSASVGSPQMYIWKGAYGGTTWGTGQRVFADNYHPNADTLTTARTIAGTSFNGSANIDINYNNLTNKPTIPSAYSLPEATATVRGGIELFSNTDQSVAANSVSATSGRTYGIQLNSAGQAVVNVPWSDTNTDTNTTYTAGSGLTLSGTEFSHSDTSSQGSVNNSYGTVIQDITLDTYGHITAIDSANLDSRYYTETETNGFLNLKANLASPTFTGNVGIGDSYPISKLHVQDGDIKTVQASGSFNGGTFAAHAYDINGRYAKYLFGINDTTYQRGMIYERTSGRISIINSTNTGMIGERLTVTTSGKVGIGTTNPTQFFEAFPDNNFSGVIGKVYVGYVGYSDYAAFSHFDQDTTTGYALRQGSAGDTLLNAKSGQSITLRNSNYVIATVNSTGLDVTGIATADAFRTDTSNTGYNLITRNSTSGTLYVQAAQSNSTQTIASFRYGSAIVNAGTETFRIRRDNVNVFGANFTVGGSITGNSKNFSIPHPTKEGKRLVHSCLEGPEIGVYFRGRSTSATIEMPDYWDGLVHLDSMTVELTAVGPNQDLYVASIADDGDVTVGSNTDTPLNYFYVIYGERKDLERLEVEIDDTVEVEESLDNSEETNEI